MKKYVTIFITSPLNFSHKIAKYLLQEKIVACVNIVKKLDSYYWWENKIVKGKESLLIIKTRKGNFEKLVKEIKKLHPYEIPEIISFDISKGNKEYLNWITNSTKKYK
ncbi:MAG: divalent-cation tolerance protein CutA [Endomicrobia bacterium]|nr:divalent-cation tolerance protein CutA [Endomicrobiia bacterium]